MSSAMIEIETAQLSTVTGGICLRPGATPGTANPITASCGTTLGLVPGATAGTPRPVAPRVTPRFGLRPGAIADSLSPLRRLRR